MPVSATLAWGLVLGLVIPSQLARAADLQRVTVCDLVAHPDKYTGANVQVSAQTEGDWFETASIYDIHCIGRFGVTLGDNLKGANTVALDALYRAVRVARDRRTPTHHFVVFATFRGQFTYMPKFYPRTSINLSDVEDVRVAEAPSAIPPPPPWKKTHRGREAQ